MRILPGMPTNAANFSMDSYSLMKYIIADPDILPTAFEMFYEEGETPLTTILNIKNMKTRGLYPGFIGNGIQVKSNVIQYAIKNSDKVKCRFVKNADGKTVECPAYPTKIGYRQSDIYFWADNNWAGYKEVIELADGRTQLYIISEYPVQDGSAWRYTAKLVTKNLEEYVDPFLFNENMEFTPVYTKYEHDFSETGVEKYTFDSFGVTHLTVQRLKYSIGGGAQAMQEVNQSKVWTMHKGKITWLTYAQYQMLKRAAEYHEYCLIFGKGTVDESGEVILKDKRGREIISGDGLLNANEGAYDYPIDKGGWTLRRLENIMSDIDIRADYEGKKEVIMLCGRESFFSFNRMMREEGFVTMNNNVVGEGDKKGVNNNYAYYELGDVRIVPKLYRWFDDPAKPSLELSDGTRHSSWESIFIPTGLTKGGDPQVQLCQLRKPVSGVVYGINRGGEMANSIDGEHHHFLFQTGIICRTKIARAFRNVKS